MSTAHAKDLHQFARDELDRLAVDHVIAVDTYRDAHAAAIVSPHAGSSAIADV